MAHFQRVYLQETFDREQLYLWPPRVIAYGHHSPNNSGWKMDPVRSNFPARQAVLIPH